VFGFWGASVALSRAELGQGLREVVQLKLRQSFSRLSDLMKVASKWKLFDKSQIYLADKGVYAGNRVLHGKPTNEPEAWDTLCSARGVLEHLFAAE